MDLTRGATFALAELPPADFEPASARLVIAGGGVRRDYALALTDGRWAVTVPVTDTTAFVAGQAQGEIAWTDASGMVRITPLDAITVHDSLTANESITDRPLSLDEQILAAAKKALLTAAGDTSISVSTPGGADMSFETRSDLLLFVERLERKIDRSRRHFIPLWNRQAP